MTNIGLLIGWDRPDLGLIKNMITKDNQRLGHKSFSFKRSIIYFSQHFRNIVFRSSSNIISLTLVIPIKSQFSKNLPWTYSTFLVYWEGHRIYSLFICLDNLQNNKPSIFGICFLYYELYILTSAGQTQIRRWFKVGFLPVHKRCVRADLLRSMFRIRCCF